MDEEYSLTSFQDVYDVFLSKITDDMFMEMTEEDTHEILQEILLQALPMFEMPRKDIFDIDKGCETFRCHLDFEEINILATYMVVAWIGFQLATIDVVRQRFSSSDFSFTSQASHMDKLMKLKNQYTDEGQHLQRVYDRRRLSRDWGARPGYVSDFGRIMEKRRSW